MSSKMSSSDALKSDHILNDPNGEATAESASRIFPSCPEEEIVISGLAGRYPNSDNVDEFRHHLYNKIDMTTDKEVRWPNNMSTELPKRKGVLKSLSKFDGSFFGIHSKQTNTMDPQARPIIEAAFEAILDAGIHPQSLRDTRTGVFVGVCYSEAEKNLLFESIGEAGLALSGCARAMIANRISYCLGLNGPSFSIDTACSSSMFALDQAFSALRSGQCENALVCGTNLLLHPYTTIQFYRLGVISKDGTCRPFDKDGAGYSRSEAICAMLLQKARNAKRIYAKLVYSNTNCDGYKNEGLLYPSGESQRRLLSSFYKNLKLDPRMVSYVEAHGTGTKVGDPEECSALDRVFCKNRKEPLLIGSVKSNMGHCEGGSGICSVTKAILAFETGLVAPNLNFTRIREDIPALAEGRLKVCTELTPLQGNLIAANSFGFGGANAHVLLARFEKDKINSGLPNDSVPRLVMWSGRTQVAVEKMFDSLETKPLDAEFVALLHNTQKYNQTGFLYRGYSILEKNDENNNSTAKCLGRMIERFDADKAKPLIWIFTGMGSQWNGMATSLMQIDMFRDTIKKCHEILKPRGIDLISIVTSTDESTFDNIVHSFVGIAAIQIAIVNILKALEVPMDYCIGHSVGELGCAYADNTVTAEQMLLAAYERGIASIETKVTYGSMAAVGLSYSEVKDMIPETIAVACHNSPNSSTISGPKEDVTKFVNELKSKKIFAKEVACSNIPYHSKYIAEMGPKLLKKMQQLVPEPKRRSEKWISTSVPKEEWDKEQSKFSSAEYHANNMLKPVLFEEAARNLPEDAITIEIAPHGLLQAVIKKCLPNATHIPLTQRANKENAIFFLSALGKLYMNGILMPIERLYPAVSFPVSRGTQMISPLILWDHSQDWFSGEYNENSTQISCERKLVIDVDNEENQYMTGHIIDGRCILPATSYLHFVRESIVSMTSTRNFDGFDIEFENVRFLRATSLEARVSVRFSVVIHAGSGDFEISEHKTAVMSGNVKIIQNGIPIKDLSQIITSNDTTVMDSKDFYKELRLRGYNYAGIFKSVVEIRGDGSFGKIKWMNNWPSFMDCMLQVNILALDSRALYLPTSVRKIRINTAKHLEMISQLDPENPVMEVRMCKDLNIVSSGGIEIEGLVCSSVGRRKPPGTEVLESYEFVPYNSDAIEYEPIEGVSIIMQTALENLMQMKLKIVECDTNEPEPKTLIQLFDEAINYIPLVTADLTLLRKEKIEIDHVTVQDGDLKSHTNSHIIIGSKWLHDTEAIAQAQASLVEKGFLVLREASSVRWHEIQRPEGFNLISVIRIPNELLLILQRIPPESNDKTVITVDSKDVAFEWLEPLKEAVKKGVTIALEQNNSDSGLLGLINCVRREPGGTNIRCLQIEDETAPNFNLDEPLFSEQIKLDLAVNVYRKGKWGAYRHLLLKKDMEEKPRKEHYYANLQRIGDLSTFEWMTGWINAAKSQNLVNIQYSAINFRDVMLATGRLPLEMHSTNRLHQQCVLGLEYSGTSKTGERLMGMVAIGAMATQAEFIENLTWTVPPSMSLRDAATIPVVYATIYYAFFFYRPISKGKSILIHAGSGGVGLAAIRIALAYGMEVFTTCSNEQKKKFIMQQYPQIKEENIGNSRDCSFEQMILIQTKGKGVDYVLNSLAEDKLAASVRCLGRGGVFLEIGKFDIINNNKLDMGTFAKEIQFRAVMADNLIHLPKERETLFKMMERDLESGLIQPLHSTAFKVNEVEKAFRYLSTGKHVGKVLIQIRENENSEASMPMRVYERTLCDPHMVYIIAGGLGGFGLELADWLVLRGCRRLVLSSRTGVRTGYQVHRIKLWESYGCKVVISTADITTHQGCKKLIIESLTHGAVGGIFNLAVLLRDSIFENQSCDKFFESFGPKVFATRYLDELSRVLCQRLHYFVVFSSAACGRGNAGQTNYAMANSIMERIIEKRVRDNLHGKAIQWGAIGEVGLVAQMAEEKIDLEIVGTVQQRIASCLSVMDSLLTSKQPVVSSIVVAQKHSLSKLNLLQRVLHIMGIRDLKSVSKNSSLAELGMDSLMAVEIKQTLEREFDVNLTAQDLRTLTFAKLQEYTEGKAAGTTTSTENDLMDIQQNTLLRSLGHEQMATKTIMPLNELASQTNSDACALFIPGIEGVISPVLYTLCKAIEIPMFALQLHAHCREESFQKLISLISEDVLNLFNGKKRFYLIAHSFGALVAIELAKLLERKGLKGDVIIADGSTSLFKRALKSLMPNAEATHENVARFLQMQLAYQILPEIKAEDIQKIMLEEKTMDARIDKFISLVEKREYTDTYLKDFGYGLLYRVLMVLNESDEYTGDKIQSNITLIRPTTNLVVNIENDYELKQYTNGKVTVGFIEGTHLTMLDNKMFYQIINNICTNES